MIRFFIKKAFFDGWDHLWGLVLLNLGGLAIVALFILLPLSVEHAGVGSWLPPLLGVILCAAYMTICAGTAREVAEYRDITFTALRTAAGAQGLAGIVYGAISAGIGGLFYIAVPFYLSQGTVPAYFALGTLFWCSAAILLAIQWFPAVRALMPGSLKKTIRKCFMLMIDNFGFSLFLALYTLLNLVVSVFTALLIPGLAGTALGSVDALRLILKKYDWLEANPGVDRKKVPWDALLEEEKELVGKRTFKGMIFPWKE